MKLIKIVLIAFVLAWLGLYWPPDIRAMLVASSSALLPNLAVEVGLPRPQPDSVDSSLAVAKFLGDWPKASVHQISSGNVACRAVSPENTTIFYKATVKAHLTAFRMANVMSWDRHTNVAWVPMTPEVERDCGATDDLIILPFHEALPPRFHFPELPSWIRQPMDWNP
jgi:hypothetical protein